MRRGPDSQRAKAFLDLDEPPDSLTASMFRDGEPASHARPARDAALCWTRALWGVPPSSGAAVDGGAAETVAGPREAGFARDAEP
jgi:hypothetical protein